MTKPKGSGTRIDWMSNLELLLDQTEEDSNGCYIWQNSTDSNGYGQFSYSDSEGNAFKVRPHRVVACLVAGVPYSDPRIVRHLCPNKHNPACINPAHLKLGTPKENAQDSIDKVGAPLLLDDEMLEDIVGLVGVGMTIAQIASLYGVGHNTIRRGLKRYVGSN